MTETATYIGKIAAVVIYCLVMLACIVAGLLNAYEPKEPTHCSQSRKTGSRWRD